MLDTPLRLRTMLYHRLTTPYRRTIGAIQRRSRWVEKRVVLPQTTFTLDKYVWSGRHVHWTKQKPPSLRETLMLQDQVTAN